MMLKQITANHPDLAAVKELYEEAFPANERVMTIDELLALPGHMPGVLSVDIFGIYPNGDADDFSGFLLAINRKLGVYLLFFAICPDKRTGGVGSKALQAFKSLCGAKPIILEYESVYEASDNAEQRERRRAFYQRNGFYETDWFLLDNGCEFIIASSQEALDHDAFEEYAHGFVVDESGEDAPKLFRRD